MFPAALWAQSSQLPQGNPQEELLERMEIKLQRQPDLNLLGSRGIDRQSAVAAALYADSLQQSGGIVLSAVDKFNIQQLLMNNSEWYQGDRSGFAGKRPIWNTFYRTRANLLEVNQKDFFLALNPVLQQQQSSEADNNERVFLNSKGLRFRGLIAGKLGFDAYLTDNQERGPVFVQDWIADHRAVPGAGFNKSFKRTARDYFDGRGSVYFTAAKYLHFQFGYDKNFIGNGYRSLFLSDFSNSYLFLKINTRIWKLNYENLFMELTPTYVRGSSDNLLDKKYAAMHHLSLNVAPWLNLGVFEAVIFGRKNHFDFTYLNPIIFLRIAEQQNGSSDNAVVGFDYKANIAKRLQLYGQFMLDEFVLKEMRAGNGWWGNKFGVQVGGKYVDFLGIKNLDAQAELNLARPFTYTHYDSVSNYSHYNQPLAHPLGANFIEAIGILRYQPAPKWTTSARLILWKQGVDTLNSNVGSDIFMLNTTRMGDYGYSLPSGPLSKGINAQWLVSYQALPNLFLDCSVLLRRLNANVIPDQKTSMFTIGIRMNTFRREYDY